MPRFLPLISLSALLFSDFGGQSPWSSSDIGLTALPFVRHQGGVPSKHPYTYYYLVALVAGWGADGIAGRYQLTLFAVSCQKQGCIYDAVCGALLIRQGYLH